MKRFKGMEKEKPEDVDGLILCINSLSDQCDEFSSKVSRLEKDLKDTILQLNRAIVTFNKAEHRITNELKEKQRPFIAFRK